jgi:hypothetical protein
MIIGRGVGDEGRGLARMELASALATPLAGLTKFGHSFCS